MINLKKFYKTVFVLFTIFSVTVLSGFYISLSVQAEESIVLEKSYNSTIISSIYNLGKELKYDIDKEQLFDNLSYFGSSPLVSEKISPDAVIKAARNQGIFLNGFRLEENVLDKLSEIQESFIVYLKDIGYCVVKSVVINSDKYCFKCILPDKRIKDFSKEEFISLWDKNVFSLPLVGMMAKRLNSGNVNANNRFIAIYSYHSDEDFNEFSKILDNIRKEAEDKGQKLIYLDELGLIPDGTIKQRMESLNVSKQEAFNQIKNSIKEEDNMLEKGIPVHLPNPFYNKIFSYLAKYKIKSIIEDLDYFLWEQIVSFDKLKLHDKATKLFFTRNIDDYVFTMKEYTRGFWEHNVKKRDELYRKQIQRIINKYPDALIFTLRGIGHYGMEENIETDDFSVETLVFAQGRFRSNLISSQVLHVLWANGVRVKESKERMMFLKSFVQESLRAYLKNKDMKISEATRKSVKMTKDLTEKDIIELSADISRATLLRKFKKTENVWEFVYNWVSKNKENLPEFSEAVEN